MTTITTKPQIDCEIADISLAPLGRKRIDWARAHMPIMRNIIERFEKEQPFKGLTIGICLHVEAKTGVWLEALTKGGARVAITGSPGTTQDETVAAIVEDYGVHVYSQRNESFEDHLRYCQKVLDHQPNIISDNGADLHELLFTLPQNQHLIDQLLGATEETTTGANRLREDFKSDKFATLIINDTQAKRIIENRYGVGSSVVDGLMRATNVMLHGKKVVVIGYGYCGSGTAQRLRGMGAHVTVVEPNPLTRLEAHMEGFYTASIEDALPNADMVITITGRDNVLDKQHFELMANNVIIANAGHFQREINLPALAEMAESVEAIRPQVKGYKLNDKTLFVLSDANLVNLAAGDGNPIEIMDLGLALQSLSLERIALGVKSLSPIPQPVPYDIELDVAALACQHWINH
ncbi:adenosylhomocysteinase [Shewanella pealeana]|uniref:Adenosylhomocysteinase n=1 Tax=Shewanella pealeana (strain ATCC 700345 / ANG-SQ1) TaxID=398579 RepID=A8H827_SHEPA|nr:adenosylhomocysteinase [Shewanella pealeana]ABV88714.1 Adenosylhomocysteinase [Shewanella pealeana ATCC 700345]